MWEIQVLPDTSYSCETLKYCEGPWPIFTSCVYTVTSMHKNARGICQPLSNHKEDLSDINWLYCVLERPPCVFSNANVNMSLAARENITHTHTHTACSHFPCFCLLLCSCELWKEHKKMFTAPSAGAQHCWSTSSQYSTLKPLSCSSFSAPYIFYSVLKSLSKLWEAIYRTSKA